MLIIKSLLIEIEGTRYSELYTKHLSTNPPNAATFVTMNETHITQRVVDATPELIAAIKADPDMEVVSGP